LLNGLQQQITEENNEREQQKSDLEFNKVGDFFLLNYLEI